MPTELDMTDSKAPFDDDWQELPSDAVDDVDTSNGEEKTIQPWNPAKIRITTKSLSLREVVEQIGGGDIDLAPDFQREYVWKRRQRTRLIESVLLGIPLPAFYFNQEDDATYQVVDGVQRLSTINLFMNNKHILDAVDLEYLKDLHGRTYDKLDQTVVRRFRSAQIVCHIIEPQTPDEVKYDIFSRVNTLGSPLSTQEIRHAMSKKRSRMFLKVLSELESFDAATAKNFWIKDPDGGATPVRDTGRMMNRELALRFCAFKSFSADEYRKYSSLDSYLVEYTRRIDGRSETAPPFTDMDLVELTKVFNSAMTNASFVMGADGFRRFPPGGKRKGPINRAVFESQALAFADYSLDKLTPKKDAIATALRRLFEDPDYLRSVTVGTGNIASVELRLRRTKKAIKEIIQ